jgi:hypothetical protein
MKYIFILYAFYIVNIYIILYILDQILKSLTCTKTYAHHIMGRREHIRTQPLSSWTITQICVLLLLAHWKGHVMQVQMCVHELKCCVKFSGWHVETKHLAPYWCLLEHRVIYCFLLHPEHPDKFQLSCTSSLDRKIRSVRRLVDENERNWKGYVYHKIVPLALAPNIFTQKPWIHTTSGDIIEAGTIPILPW